MLTTLPRLSISLTRPKVAMELARVAMRPAAAVSLTPSTLPSFKRGFRSTRVRANTSGNAPANTMAMAPTVWNATSTVSMPGISTKPVRLCTMAAARPTVIKAIMPLPKMPKPLIMAFSAFHRPSAISAPMSTMGIRLRSTITGENPATKPPTRIPTGMVTIPARIPFAM